jgi:hypothetical protein
MDAGPAEGEATICFLLMFMPDETTMDHPNRVRRIKKGIR